MFGGGVVGGNVFHSNDMRCTAAAASTRSVMSLEMANCLIVRTADAAIRASNRAPGWHECKTNPPSTPAPELQLQPMVVFEVGQV